MRNIFVLLFLIFSFGANAQYIEQLRGRQYGIPVVDASSPKKKIKIINGTAGQVLTKGAGNLITWATPVTGTDDQKLTFDASTNVLTLEDGGTVNLVGYLDNTDDQKITELSIDNTTSILTITLEDGGTNTVDLVGLKDNLGNHTATQTFNLNGNNLIATPNTTLRLYDSYVNGRGGAIQATDNAGSVAGYGIYNLFNTRWDDVNTVWKKNNGTMYSYLFSLNSHKEGFSWYSIPPGIDSQEYTDIEPFLKMKLDKYGNLGIGTTTPSEKLEVVGNTLINNGDLYIRKNNSTALGVNIENIDNTYLSIKRIGVDPSSLNLMTFNNKVYFNFNAQNGAVFKDENTGNYMMAIRNNGVRINKNSTDIVPNDTGVLFQVDGVGKFSSTVSGADAVNPTDFVTKQQLDANGDTFETQSSSYTYATTLSEGRKGIVENTSASSITITAPTGITFSNKGSSSSSITIAGNETVSFISIGSVYRVINIY